MFVKATKACGHIYSDQTGRFLVQSSRGYKYILIFYNLDSNAILWRPLKTREGHEIMDNILEVITMLISRGYHSKLYCLDYKITSKLKTLLHLAFIDFQLLSPNIHQRNTAKHAIQTWKSHLISTLCTVDPLFPLYL